MDMSTNEENVDEMLEQIAIQKTKVLELQEKIQNAEKRRMTAEENVINLNAVLKEKESFIQNLHQQVAQKESHHRSTMQDNDELMKLVKDTQKKVAGEQCLISAGFEIWIKLLTK